MSKEKLAPKVRFEEFSAIWKYHGLLDSVTKVIDFRGRTPKKLGLDWSRNGFLALSALNVKNGYIDKDADAHYGDRKLYNKWMLGNELHKGQVLFTTEAPMGNVAQVPDNNKYILSQRTIAFEVKENWITEDYLAVVLRTPSIFRELTTLSSGGTAKGVSQRTLSELDIPIPKDIREQHKIGEFFKKIDKMIQLQQSKVNKVKDIKSAYLSEMFPKDGEKYPKKRFEGFTEPWTAKKLGSLLDYEQPTNYLVKSDSYDDSYLTPVLTAGKSFLLGYTNETEGIYKADNNGVIIFDDFTTSSHFVDFDFKVKSSAMKFLRTNQSNFNLYFLYNLLTSINYSPESHERHWISIFSEFEVLVPTKKEQEKIAQLFKNLDTQISIEEEKLKKLEKLKQAYLNDMFI